MQAALSPTGGKAMVCMYALQKIECFNFFLTLQDLLNLDLLLSRCGHEKVFKTEHSRKSVSTS